MVAAPMAEVMWYTSTITHTLIDLHREQRTLTQSTNGSGADGRGDVVHQHNYTHTLIQFHREQRTLTQSTNGSGPDGRGDVVVGRGDVGGQRAQGVEGGLITPTPKKRTGHVWVSSGFVAPLQIMCRWCAGNVQMMRK